MPLGAKRLSDKMWLVIRQGMERINGNIDK